MSSYERDCELESQTKALLHSTFQKNKCLYEVYKKNNHFNANLFPVGKIFESFTNLGITLLSLSIININETIIDYTYI